MYRQTVHFNTLEQDNIVERTGEVISSDGNSCIIEYEYYPYGCHKPVLMHISKSCNDVWTE